ncbi:MAG: type II and III secretion system protein family protein [Pirellulales bacterium]|nr:type II and III secretion system protein family protein [Pirellulales bacterium]
MVRHELQGSLAPSLLVSLLALAAVPAWAQTGPAIDKAPIASINFPQTPPILHKISAASERLEMTVSTSRILTLEKKIPQAQVNNPDLLELTPLSPNQIQIFAKKPGVTQVNLWDENDRVYTVDVLVFGDARELLMLLRTEFPNAALQVKPVSQGVLISGYVDQPQHVGRIVQLAEEYYPKVINNITVGGVQQVLLHVKVMEISRTKLRALGFDWSVLGDHTAMYSAVSGLLAAASSGLAGNGSVAGSTVVGSTQTAAQTFGFHVVDGSSAFFGVLEALRQDNLMKVLAEPTLVTVSGRPAFFNVGGEIPVLVPQSLGTVAIEWKKFGTQIDFVPIVLGNGQIRLEVRPRVSEIDPSRSVTLDTYTIPGLRVREVETGVEMKAGQTLAIAGLVQERTEALRRGLPWVGELPYVGTLFGRVREERNEIELLILVTPELVAGVDPSQLPPCGPGMNTSSPSDHELYLKRYIETPNCCPACDGAGCEQCGAAGRPVPGMPPGMILGPSESVQPQPAPPAPPAAQPAPASGASASRISGFGAAQATDSPVRQIPSKPQRLPATTQSAAKKGDLPGLLGPIGYDAAQ